MILDDMRNVLLRVRDLGESPAFKDAVGHDIAGLENAAANGLSAVERHIAGWFGAVYGTDPGTGAAPVTPGAVPVTGASGTAAPPAGGAAAGAVTADDPTGITPAGQEALPGT
jgi:hypothetical protein